MTFNRRNDFEFPSNTVLEARLKLTYSGAPVRRAP